MIPFKFDYYRPDTIHEAVQTYKNWILRVKIRFIMAAVLK
jgi:hypothetical protein